MITEKAEKTASLVEHQAALNLLLSEFDRVCKALDIPYILFAGTMLGAVRHHGFIPWDDDLDILMMRDDYERFLNEAEGELDCEKFFLQKEFSEHWPMFFTKLRLNGTTCLEKFHPKDENQHQGIYIDIFPCDNAMKSEAGKKLQFLASKVVIAKALDRRGYETESKLKKVFIKVCRLLPKKLFVKIAKAGRSNSASVHSFFAAAKGYSKNVYPREYITNTINMDFEDGSYPVSVDYDALLRIIYGDYMILPSPEERKIKQHAVLVDTECSYEHYRDYHRNLKFDVLTRSIR